MEQVAGTGFFQVEAPSFEGLSAHQRLLAYWLGRAAIAIDPIIYDQLSAYGLREKRLIGAMVEKPDRLPAAAREPVVTYAKLFFANRGNHNEVTNRKFVPELSFASFAAAAQAARAAGAPLGSEVTLARALEELRAPLFDPDFEPSPTAKTPPPGKDIITASSNTFYGPGVTLADLMGFHDAYPLNSRVAKVGHALSEEVYRTGRAGGPAPGLYARELGQAIDALAQAKQFADPRQAGVIDALIRFYQTGEAKDWHEFDVAWVQDDAAVDFVNGFIETYRDARSAKGAAESLVSVTDQKLNPLMQKLASNALYFEKRAPWEDRFRKLDMHPPVGKAVEVLVETGDFSVSIIGDDLPNEEDIHLAYGTKNFLMTNAVDVFRRTRGAKLVAELDPEDVARYEKYGALADNLLTAMHEIIGHGSGKSVVAAEPRETLREYYSTLEEARADLVAYWNAYDPKLSELGVEDQTEVAHEMYRQLARSVVGVLNHYPKGDQAEEDHDRDRLLIWSYVREHGGLKLVERNGVHRAEIADWDKAHQAVGSLLAELMRIKGEGDYVAIKALVERLGVKFDPALRDEVVKRYARLGIPTYAAGIYPDLELTKLGSDVRLGYPRDFLGQQLRFARANGSIGMTETR